MSAERIRQAAKVLRDAAHGATPGPWEANADGTIDGNKWDTVIGRGDVKCSSYCYGGSSTIEGDRLERDAAYIALMAPPVALALAEWLDAMAGFVESGNDVPGMRGRGFNEALTLAETILGGKS